MKGRLGSTIWMLVIANFAVMVGVLVLGYWAGGWAKACRSQTPSAAATRAKTCSWRCS
jgi:hypothetical protein